MYEERVRLRAAALLASGASLDAASRELGVARSTLREWRDRPDCPARRSGCPRCDGGPLDGSAYAHLLGLYLGDGCVSELHRHVHSLRIACDQQYPGLIRVARASMRLVRPGARTYLVRAPGCVHVAGLWKHSPCLFPQHGPGRNTRPIALADWQRQVVEQHPGRFLRGLFRSDGCRVTNRTVRTVADRRRRYEYPRYFFSHRSTDIIGLCTWALDLLDIRWRMARPTLVSVARREAVAALDECVGPKY